MAIKDLALDVARKAKRLSGKVVDALEGSGKTHVVSERSEVFRIPMPDGVPIIARVTTKRLRVTYDGLRDPHQYNCYEISTADSRGCTVSGPGPLSDVLGRFIFRATGECDYLRVRPSALTCSECGGCGILGNERCKVCRGSGMRPIRECIRHIALNLQKAVPIDDHDALMHVANAAMFETDEFYSIVSAEWKQGGPLELLDAMRACVIFYLGALARVKSIGNAPQFKACDAVPPSPITYCQFLMEKAAKAVGKYAEMVHSVTRSIPYHRSESARFMVLMGLESQSGGLTVDKLGMTIFTEVRPDGSVNVQDAWSPEFFRHVLADTGSKLHGNLLAEYCARVSEVTWAIESTAQKAGMLPGESLAAFIERLRTERNEAHDKLAEALETLNG